MKYTQDLAGILKTALKASKKISRIDDLLEDVEEFIYNVNLLNSLERNATTDVNGFQLSDIPFPAALASMIYPNSVTVNGKEQDVDFLARPEVALLTGKDAPKVWKRGDWLDFGDKLYNAHRAQRETISVAELRTNEILANVAEISAAIVNPETDGETEVCGYACEERFPIPLAIQVKKSAFYSQYTVDMANNYIFRNMLLSISKK